MQLRKSESPSFSPSKREITPTKLVKEATKRELMLANDEFAAAKLKKIVTKHEIILTKDES